MISLEFIVPCSVFFILDIRLEDGSGFELIDHFDKSDSKVIFLSAHADYAIKAIKHDAIDYLLKPLKEDDLAQAIKKAHGGGLVMCNGNHVPVASRQRDM